MILVVGEILVDEFPGYSRVGGAPFNFALHLHRFGLPVRFISRVGNDDNGKRVLDFVSSSGLPAGDIQVDPDYPTGRVKVTLDEAGVPNFDIIKNTAYDRVKTEGLQAGKPGMIYYGTLIQRTAAAFDRVQGLLKAHTDGCRTFCDINLRSGCYSRETVRASMLRADILKLSADEAAEIAGMTGLPPAPEALAEALFDQYGVKTLILTRGAEGSDWFSPGYHRRVSPPPLASVADTVGAGDAFAAAAAFGILRGAEPDKILRTASSFAAAVCQIEGAVPPDDAIHREFLLHYE